MQHFHLLLKPILRLTIPLLEPLKHLILVLEGVHGDEWRIVVNEGDELQGRADAHLLH